MTSLSLVSSKDTVERAPRKSILRAVTLFFNGIERRAIVRNISDTGAMIETDLYVEVGDMISIDIAGHGKREAVVRWVQGARAGIEFTQAMQLGHAADPRFAALNQQG